MVTSCQLYDNAAALALRERIDGVDVHRVRTTRFGRDKLVGRAADYANFYLAAGWRLWRIARAGDVIVAKTDPPLISVIAALVARRRGARLVNWVQDAFPEVAEALGVRARSAAWSKTKSAAWGFPTCSSGPTRTAPASPSASASATCIWCRSGRKSRATCSRASSTAFSPPGGRWCSSAIARARSACWCSARASAWRCARAMRRGSLPSCCGSRAMRRCARRWGRARALLCERYDKRIAFKAWLALLGEL